MTDMMQSLEAGGAAREPFGAGEIGTLTAAEIDQVAGGGVKNEICVHWSDGTVTCHVPKPK